MVRRLMLICLGILAAYAANDPCRLCAADSAARKIVLIAGKKSHGPEGNGIHDYPWSVKLLKVLLDNSNVRDRICVEYHLDGWPKDPATLDTADAIMVVSDGRDGDLYEEAPHFRNEAQRALVERQIRRGCGFLTFHFSTFAPDQFARQILDWSGGYFDWETDGQRKWYSAIRVLDAAVQLGDGDHPVLRGVQPFTMKEEYYYNIRFDPRDNWLHPLLIVPALEGRQPDGNVVAWARERPDGGRGFGTTCGHFYDNWRNDDFRRLILNALVWAAKAEVPAGGVQSQFYDRAEITTALTGKQGLEQALVDNRPIRVLLVAGNEAHKWHNWEKTTAAIQQLLQQDSRIKVDVSLDIEELASRKLSDYQVLVQNYVNWKDPRGISEPARAALAGFVRGGGGLVLVHFANGAFHFSLPDAGASDWPEYRKLVRRVWNHHGQGETLSGHDAFGMFNVKPTELPHAITAGLNEFPVNDELYFRQNGDEPIEPLLVAHSKVTDRDEPLAWVYTYGQGRVFQTLLGHSEKTYDSFEPAEMLRRAVAWTAGRAVRTRLPRPATPPSSKPAASQSQPDPPTRIALAPGRFGSGLDARRTSVVVAASGAQRDAPLTAECWAKVDHHRGFQILLASEEKSSPTHWELYAYDGSGVLSAYLPGRGGEYKSDVNICDAQWHHLVVVIEAERIRLFVDARMVLDRRLTGTPAKSQSGHLAIGRLVEGTLGCAGTIDEVRLTRGPAPLRTLPDMPPRVEANTVGLWRFDQLDDEHAVRDETSAGLPARLIGGTPAGNRKLDRPIVAARPDHWGVESVGFNWTEADSVDDRWQHTELGSFQASSLPLPGSPLRKGLSVRVGQPPRATLAFDTEFLRWRAAWTGGFLQFDPARYGLIGPPRPAGPLMYSTREGAGWTACKLRYLGLQVHNDRVVLNSLVGNTRVRESPWYEELAGIPTLTRTIEVDAKAPVLAMHQFDIEPTTRVGWRSAGAWRLVLLGSGDRQLVAAVAGDGLTWRATEDQQAVELALSPSHSARRFRLLVAALQADQLQPWLNALEQLPPSESLEPLLVPGSPRWTKPIVTRGQRSKDDAPYVVDTLTMPHDNPYRALFFAGGHDFLPDGRIAVCTAHGDVWTVAGVDDSLERLTWKRMATGLFQPLGLKVHEGQVYVLGRDQITRIVDHNGDGEADEYQCVNNQAFTSYGGHDYVTCLELGRDGWFYFVHATQGLVRASVEGDKLEVIATGFRNPNGMGLGPAGELTVAPQEGEWVPGSNIALVRPGGYYGYGGPKVTVDRPRGYDPPLCWIPRMVDNSSGGQAWVTSDRWGPLQGQLLHFSFGKCRLLLVVRESIDGLAQGGTVAFPLQFSAGAHRGRFSPHDGQLYVTGLKGWVTSAVEDGCLQRVRYTGQDVYLPERVVCLANGLAITFTGRLDKVAAEDPENYNLSQWNYRYAAAYGSADWKVSDPRQEGHDPVDVRSATLLDDGRTVFLEVDPLRPAHQLEIQYAVRSHDGKPVQNTLNYTIHAVNPRRMDAAKLVRHDRPAGLSSEQLAQLRTGILAEVRQDQRVFVLPLRQAALAVAVGERLISGWQDSPFEAKLHGLLLAPLRGRYEFRLEGRGTVTLKLAGNVLVERTPIDVPGLRPGQGEPEPTAVASLHKGPNPLEIQYHSPESGVAELRLLWRGAGFGWEPVPSTALAYLPPDDAASEQPGWFVAARHRCLACHRQDQDRLPRGDPFPPHDGTDLKAWANRRAPSLADAGTRLTANWLTNWLSDPAALRPDSTMPRVLRADTAEGRQEIADIVAFLATRSLDRPQPAVAVAVDNDARHAQGLALYEDLGCLACHQRTPPQAASNTADHRISLAWVAEKFPAGKLAEFLKQPHAADPWRKMPNFRLDDQQAAALEHWLRVPPSDVRIEPLRPALPGDAMRGQRLFVERRCLLCHPINEKLAGNAPSVPTLEGRRAAEIRTTGCLANEPADRRQAPRIALSQAEREALMQWIATGCRIPDQPGRIDLSRYLFDELRCGACHSRDGWTSPRGLLLADEGERGLPPEVLPNLSWAGHKLLPKYVETLLSGDAPPARPWLKARMPAFPAYAKWLARGLAAEHGFAPVDAESTRQADVHMELGNRLTQKDALDCRQCHAVGQEQPRGDANTQIALGVNFQQVGQRVRYDYYRRFVLNPPRYDVGTKMPVLALDGRTTRVTQILDGDARAQFDAIWEFIQAQGRSGDAAPSSAPLRALRRPE